MADEGNVCAKMWRPREGCCVTDPAPSAGVPEMGQHGVKMPPITKSLLGGGPDQVSPKSSLGPATKPSH